jgi:hypothetical protein
MYEPMTEDGRLAPYLLNRANSVSGRQNFRCCLHVDQRSVD